MRRSTALLLAGVLALDLVAFAGLGSDKTAYIGGTENQIKEERRERLPQRTRRTLSLSIKTGS